MGTVDDLRSRVRQRLDLHLADATGAESLRGVEGVVDVEVHGAVVTVVVEGSVDAVVKAASQFTVELTLQKLV